MSLEKYKEKYLEKLKKKTVISELQGKKVYLAKGSAIPFKWMKEWRQIYPVVDEETMKINWLNFLVGGKRNLVKLIVTFILVGIIILQFYENYQVIGQALDCCAKYGPKIIP